MPLCKECQSDLTADAIICLNCGAFTGVIAPKAAAPQIPPKIAEEKQPAQRPAASACQIPAALTLSEPRNKSKPVAGIFALLLGPFGAHHFYLGGWGWGVIQIALFILVIILASIKAESALIGFVGLAWWVFALIAFIRAFIFFFGPQAAFNQKYNQSQPGPFTW